jgi:transposase
MIKIQIEQEAKDALQKIKNTRSNYSERALYVLLSATGMKVKDIAEKLDRHEHTVRAWLKEYITHGINGLISKSPPGRTKIKGVLVEEEIEKILVKTPREFGYQEEGWTVRIIMDYLFHKEILVKEDTVRRALQKKNWVYKRFAKSVPQNAPTKEEKQKRIGELIGKVEADKPDEIFFVDESNFRTGPYVQRGWFKKREKKKPVVQ